MAVDAGPRDWRTPASMVLVQLFITGMLLLSKVSIVAGMFIFALLAYRSFLGAAFILPFALISERDKWREMGWHATGWIFLNAFIGMEALQIWSIAGLLKIVGVLLSVGGTMLLSLYKGKTLHLWDPIIVNHHKERHVAEVAGNHLRGTIFLVGSSFTFACWYLIQSKVLKVYPYKYWSSMTTCLVGGLQTSLVGILLRRDKNTWKLGWDLNLVTIIYSPTRYNNGDCWDLHFLVGQIKRSAGQIDLTGWWKSSCSYKSYESCTCIPYVEQLLFSFLLLKDVTIFSIRTHIALSRVYETEKSASSMCHK
uniref:WAT1-related protein n=1 Tax=Aegilops tauschii subsp. strangulata TaxID=200361 RepID=A0A453M870_AEGTS